MKLKHSQTKIGKSLNNKRCPRCSSIMANHRTRWYCGKCHYTEFL
ncbi:MAG: 30S ribosomal protein S27ae [Candidatus Aenigmarchaeota archaeon]|nr:30S ribosomal protein S27ae [Candidatus Aenigmarchaeota archaeon]MCX8190842.1 30S ribosomal protein S27ae [Candidatus Aenigmarchaeota archaeon]MDW8159844.1 30S ribosomal protein S27ae [Candidatus Aenigmarchaeota archaeon]